MKDSQFNKFNVIWAINLFGTAVGAGILFLPINAGMAGFIPMILMTILVGPMTYFSHRALSRFVLSSNSPGKDITFVVSEHFGKKVGAFMGWLYFLAIWPLIMIYAVAITNTVKSFLENQLHMGEVNRVSLSFVLIVALISVMLCSEKFMLKLTEWLVYPLIAILFFFSMYLIPHWNLTGLWEMPSMGVFLKTMWLTIPALVFSFNHSPASSSFSLSMLRQYGNRDDAEKNAVKSEYYATYILVTFVMLFVFSCALSLTPEEMALAKQQNVNVLTFFANKFDNPIMSLAAPIVAFFAITSSFFGHYLGAREGLEGVIFKIFGEENVNKTKLKYCSALFFLVTLWAVAIWDPNVLSVIESLGGPIIALMLFIMPMYAIYTVPAMKHYQKERWINYFVITMGSIAISAVIYALF